MTGGDSKKRQRYDRFAVVVPCVGFDPVREFNLKYTWVESALSLARKAHQKFGDGGKTFTKAGAFKVQLRGSGVLSMHNEQNAWMTYFTHVRAARVGVDMPKFLPTSNPFLQELSGALTTSSDASVKASDL